MNALFLAMIMLLAETDSIPAVLSNADTPVLQSKTAGPLPQGIQLDHNFFDFGVIYQGKLVQHDFSIQNKTDKEIHITELKSDCGCTAATVEKTSLAPNESVAIRVTFDPERREGKIDRKVKVILDLPEPQNWFELALQAEIKTILHVFPGHVYFKDVHLGKGAEEEVVIRPGADQKVQILEVEPVEGNLTTEMIPVFDTQNPSAPISPKGNPKEWRIKLHLPKETPAGRFSAKIRIKTDSSTEPEFTFPVFGIVEGELSINPTQCLFGTLEPGAEKSKTLLLTKEGEPTLAVPKLESSISYISSEVETKKEGAEYSIKIILKTPENLKGKLAGEIKIITNDPNQPEIIVPVFGYVPTVETVAKE
jgi:hypothetical protein